MNPSVGGFTAMDSYAGSASEPLSLHKYVYGNANPVNYSDPTGNFSLGEIRASFNVLGTLVRLAVPAFRTTVGRAIKSPKLAVYKGQKRKGVKLFGGGLRFIPHYFVYIEALLPSPGFGAPGSGYSYDIGAGNPKGFFDAVISGDLSATTTGGLYKSATNRREIIAGGGKLDRIPSAKFTYMHFMAWELVAYKPFMDGFDYCVIGTNCASWTLMAIAEARMIARLPLYP